MRSVPWLPIYRFDLCATDPKLEFAYKPKGTSYQLYCPGQRQRGVGLAADHSRAGEKPVAQPRVLVALVRDRARAADLMRKRKQVPSRAGSLWMGRSPFFSGLGEPKGCWPPPAMARSKTACCPGPANTPP